MTHDPAGRRHSVRIAGSTVRYWVYGPAKGSPVIVAIHGFRGTHHGLERIVAELPGYTVIVPDLPGFGESTPLATHAHDIDGYASFVAAFIPKVTRPDEPVYLLGHSFGSIVAAKVAASGLHFNGLILVNPIAGQPGLIGRLGTRLYFKLGDILSEESARRYFSWPVAINAMSRQLTKSLSPATRRYVRAQHLAHFSDYADKRTLRESFTASVTHTVGEYISGVTVPVLLIAGSRDEIAPLKSQYKLYGNMSGPVELAVIEHVGHLTHYEKPAEVAGFIRAFTEG